MQSFHLIHIVKSKQKDGSTLAEHLRKYCVWGTVGEPADNIKLAKQAVAISLLIHVCCLRDNHI